MLILGREQLCLASSVGQVRQAFTVNSQLLLTAKIFFSSRAVKVLYKLQQTFKTSVSVT